MQILSELMRYYELIYEQANPDLRKLLRQAKKHEEENRVLEAVQPDPRIGNDLEPNKIGLDKLRVALLRDLCEVLGTDWQSA